MSHILGAIGCAIVAVTFFYAVTNRITTRTAAPRYLAGELFIVASAVISHNLLNGILAGAAFGLFAHLMWSESRKARKTGGAR